MSCAISNSCLVGADVDEYLSLLRDIFERANRPGLRAPRREQLATEFGEVSKRFELYLRYFGADGTASAIPGGPTVPPLDATKLAYGRTDDEEARRTVRLPVIVDLGSSPSASDLIQIDVEESDEIDGPAEPLQGIVHESGDDDALEFVVPLEEFVSMTRLPPQETIPEESEGETSRD